MLTKKEQRLRRSRQTRIRIATQGVARLTVNRTNLHIYASVISGDGTKIWHLHRLQKQMFAKTWVRLARAETLLLRRPLVNALLKRQKRRV